MLTLSKTQGETLNAIIDYESDKFGEIGYGVTSGKLEKLGINRKTFDNTDKNSINNKDFLVEKNFLRITRIEKHGTQNWIYYKITTLGVIAYLKWASELQYENQVIFSQTFFPLMTRHLRKIHELYGDTLNDIVSNTSLQINVKPQVTGTIKNQEHYSESIICSITLRVGDLDIIFDQFLGKYKFQKIQHDINTDFDDSENNELNDILANSYTFVFYYNLINSGLNANEMSNLFIKQYNPFKKNNDQYHTDEKEFKQTLTRLKNKLQKNHKKILTIIKNDPELHEMFLQYLDKIMSKLNQDTIIKNLKKNL